MNTRTEQDNDITLYTYGELQAMKNRYESNSTTWQPFTHDEVLSELNRRKPTFKQNWNDSDFKKMKAALRRFFVLKGLQTKDGVKICYSYADLEALLGLPYTSSSSYAGVWVTNTELRSNDYPEYNYIGFAIDENNDCYGIIWDKDENEIYIKL